MRVTNNFVGVKLLATALLLGGVLSACTPFSMGPKPGPDKQFSGTLAGAASGAGAGAVLGAQLTSPTGPAAVVGAAFGAVFGMFSGIGVDLIEENELARLRELQELREKTWVQEVLTEHYQRRLELHPSRDIYPADWFFSGDSVELRAEAGPLLREIGKLSEERMPWSRMLVAAYATSRDKDSQYSQYLTKKRAEAVAVALVRAGIEPRRVLTQGLTLSEPILIDPDDHRDRYRQAIEIIALD